ncbi:type I 3-dehydroquinate dehydratase [Clostridium merdae]|uniref:type I 3-dehydroquinate dehydratase n=1 Tax=Clostridium merdae TaxID=1958780 RepID=UPI000A26C48B|nr:type I 3-dehydroquinate dehydratase [Clostridium merdae]
MSAVTIKNVIIGEGIPKICVPIVAKTKKEILEDALDITNNRVDIVEWRVDWFESALDIEKVKDVLEELSSILGQIPLLFTLRTAREGGVIGLDAETYLQINQAVVATGYVDLIDVEVLTWDAIAPKIIESAHAAGVKVIGSSHQFDNTPSKEEMVNRMRSAQDLGADICKIAVMPQDEIDVIKLLEATVIMRQKYAEKPLVTMSMAKTGVISRVTGEIFGSALTFGTVKKASAPGQIDTERLYHILQEIHQII